MVAESYDVQPKGPPRYPEVPEPMYGSGLRSHRASWCQVGTIILDFGGSGGLAGFAASPELASTIHKMPSTNNTVNKILSLIFTSSRHQPRRPKRK